MKSSYLKFIGLSALVAGSVFTSCSSEPKKVEKTTVLEVRTLTAEDSSDKYNRLKGGDAHSGQFFSRADSTNHYGMNTVFVLNDTLIQKNLRVCVDMWVRSGDLNARHSFAIALHDGDNVLNWYETFVKSPEVELNKWTNIKDSISIPANLVSKPGLTIRAFTFNNSGKSFLDSDDITITLKKVDSLSVN